MKVSNIHESFYYSLKPNSHKKLTRRQHLGTNVTLKFKIIKDPDEPDLRFHFQMTRIQDAPTRIYQVGY